MLTTALCRCCAVAPASQTSLWCLFAWTGSFDSKLSLRSGALAISLPENLRSWSTRSSGPIQSAFILLSTRLVSCAQTPQVSILSFRFYLFPSIECRSSSDCVWLPHLRLCLLWLISLKVNALLLSIEHQRFLKSHSLFKESTELIRTSLRISLWCWCLTGLSLASQSRQPHSVLATSSASNVSLFPFVLRLPAAVII